MELDEEFLQVVKIQMTVDRVEAKGIVLEIEKQGCNSKGGSVGLVMVRSAFLTFYKEVAVRMKI